MMIELKTFTIQDIRDWKPCYEPEKHLNKDWSGNALSIAENTNIPLTDVLWVIMRHGIIPEGIQKRFAAWCAAESLFLVKSEDKRSWGGVKAAIQFSFGLITDAAWAAARAAAEAAAWDAAWDAAGAAAGAAARAAAEAAAEAAAWDAAGAAAWDAAGAAAEAAARDAAWDAQRKKLISMLKEESDFTMSDLLNNYPINMGE